ncbi:MAG: hypothetical protein IPP87_18765 [Ideonella sp.]|nr:hypothetical protein [Ideonella sp.]
MSADPGQTVEAFSIYFDWTQVSKILVWATPGDWDSLAIQADGALASDGYYDALALAAGIFDPKALGGFIARFDWADPAGPSMLRYTINDPVTFQVLESGATQTGQSVPEPLSVWLVCLGLAALVSPKHKRQVLGNTPSWRPRWRNSTAHLTSCSLSRSAPCAWIAPSSTTPSLCTSRGPARTSGMLSLSLGSKVPYTQVLDGSSKLTSIDAARLIRSSDVIVIRHDRTYPFSFANLQVAFSGQPLTDTPGQITIGAIDFLELAGRAGHEGYFEIQTNAPAAERQLQLRATIAGGATAARYSLIDQQGRTITSGDLVNPWTGQLYFVGFLQVPSVPFSIKVDANDTSGRSASYQTSPFAPSPVQTQLKVKNGAFEYGQHITGSVRIDGPPGSTQSVKLLLPEGFTAAQGSWSVPIASSGTAKIPFDITTPSTGDRVKFYDLMVLSNGSSAAIRVFAK